VKNRLAPVLLASLYAVSTLSILAAGLALSRPTAAAATDQQPRILSDLAAHSGSSDPKRPIAPLGPSQGSSGGSPSACSVAISEAIAPEKPRICDQAAVTMTMAVSCPIHLPVHIVIAIDRSKSIADPTVSDILRRIQQNVRQVLDEIDFDLDKENQGAVISHGFRVTVETDLTNQKSRVMGAANGVRFSTGDLGEDPGLAVNTAAQMLEDARRPGVSPIEIILLYGDGCDPSVNGCEQTARAAGARAKGKGMHVMAVCFTESARETCNSSYRQMVSDRSYYFEGRQASRVPPAVADLVDQGKQLVLSELNLLEWLGPDIQYIAGSGQPAPKLSLPRIQFAFTNLGRGQVATATYEIQPGMEGSLPLRAEGSQLDFVDSLGRTGAAQTLPLRDLDVGPCIVETATPTITPSPEPSSTPTRSPTQTRTPTPEVSPSPEPSATNPRPPASATATATSTPETVLAYLPLVARRICKVQVHTTDVVLVIDASSSMEQESGGQTKIAAAKQAARTFVGLLDPATDRAAVVSFHNEATFLARPTSDLAALVSAIAGIQTDQGTRIDLALEMAAFGLDPEMGTGRGADQEVIVLLTDGRPDGGTEGSAQEAAAWARSAGITIYTVGLGADVDPDLLRQLASRPEFYLEAPSADALEAIYAELARALPCPDGVLFGDS
jgi:Mg-chelatase subunit ChlD